MQARALTVRTPPSCASLLSPPTKLPCSPVLRGLTARGSYTRQPVLADDGGTLGLDWWNGADRPGYAAPDMPVVLFIRKQAGRSERQHCVAAQDFAWRWRKMRCSKRRRGMG
jgi:hypothetical protein